MTTSWPRRTLGEACQVRGGGTPSKAVKRYWHGDVPWVSPKDMKFDVVSDSIDHISQEAIDGSATSLIPKDSVLMVVRSGILARTVPIAITGRDLTINQDLKALCPNKGVDARFLYHLLNSKMDVLLSMVSRGATVHRLVTDQLRALDFILPPLLEQHRIVGILDEAFDGLATATANAEKNLQNARAIFESHLQSVFTQRGKGWEEKPLGEVCEVKDGTHDSPKYVEVGIPFVTQKNIRAEGLSFDKAKLISPAEHKNFYRRSNVAFGDILISMIGANRGMACLVDDGRVFSIKNVGLVKQGSTVNQSYLMHFLKSPRAAGYVRAASKGGAQEFIGLTELRRWPVPIPPLETQSMLAVQLDALAEETKHLESIYQQKLASVNELKKSLLHQAFNGKL